MGIAKMYRNVSWDRSPDATLRMYEMMRHNITYACMHACEFVYVCVCDTGTYWARRERAHKASKSKRI
jgi:hypothetical protein